MIRRQGPPLAGVLGRRAGSVAGFPYSNDLKAANITWGKANLERWLASPEAMVPNTDMSFKVASAEERAALVEYLSVLK